MGKMLRDMSFKDYFSKQSSEYWRYRPHYPRELYECIVRYCTKRQLALDVATGSGQAAVAMSEFFDHVIAIDGSENQLVHAVQNPKVEYRQATAEATGVEDHSVDCVTVAQALHWFDFEAFFKEVKRILKQKGVLAVWCYPSTRCTDPDINKVYTEFYGLAMSDFWPKERAYVEALYKNIHFPFEELASPQFLDEKYWTLENFAGYLGTWSSVQKYIEKHNEDPVKKFVEKTLKPLWGDPEKEKTFIFEFPLRIFRV